MDLVFLGHASWLLTLGELRILFDPLLERQHHGSVFEVFPPRRIRAEELCADFIVVSHRHPDHFDLPSLMRLAELDPDTVLLTSDELVEESARALGFRSVRRLGTYDRVTLEAGELLTTPSHGIEVEWGVLARYDGVSVYNQVDSVAGGVARVRELRELSAQALELTEPLRPDLALVRFQPLLEIEAQIGGATGFPLDAYAELLDEVAALEPRAIVPASAGSRHVAPAYMNRIVYPVTEARFVRDARARMPECNVLSARLGGRYRVERDGTADVGDAPELIERLPAQADDRIFRPFELPPITDPQLDRSRESEHFAAIEAFVQGELGPALARAFPAMQSQRPLCFTLEVIGPSETRAWTLSVSAGALSVRAGFEPDYDALCAIAASELCAVLAGRKCWGEPLLAGLLRATTRAYAVDAAGVRRLNVGVPFLYYALSYEQSVRRAVARLLNASSGARAATRS